MADIQISVIEELRKEFPGCVREEEDYLPDALLAVAQQTKNKFIIIIDEWDALFREEKQDEALQETVRHGRHKKKKAHLILFPLRWAF